MDIYKALGEKRPKWHKQAACRGMGRSFWDASQADQIEVCTGDVAPWAKPCPVAEKCLEHFVAMTIRKSSLIDAAYNTTVYGGYTPEQLVIITKSVRKEMNEQRIRSNACESEDQCSDEDCG